MGWLKITNIKTGEVMYDTHNHVHSVETDRDPENPTIDESTRQISSYERVTPYYNRKYRRELEDMGLTEWEDE